MALKNISQESHGSYPFQTALGKAVCFLRLSTTAKTVASKVNVEVSMICFGHFTQVFLHLDLLVQTMTAAQAFLCLWRGGRTSLF